MRPLPDCFLFVFVFGPTVQRDVGAWLNSAQSLRPGPAFVCVVFGDVVRAAQLCGCVGKFRTIVAAVAGFCLCCCVWGDGAARLVGAWVAAVAGFCLCCVWGGG